ncbi:peptidase U35 phage prohead HK97 [Salinisphaera sp. C84B14]|uniref:phage major capsid protein n=1 Tax=Salinisphaera sp. C84B14 TaxID=1304155 RepID=UPI00333ED782
MGLAEQINQYRDSRKAAFKKQVELTDKAANEERSLSSDEQESVDELQTEIEQIDSDVARLEKMLATEQANAEPVDKTQPGTQFRTARNTQKLDKGIVFARAARCLALGSMEHRSALEIARERYNDRDDVLATTKSLMTKAAVEPATTGNATWAGNLVSDEGAAFADFIDYLRPRTIIGQFGTDGRPALRNVPFRAPLVGQTNGGSAGWVGEAKAKPVTSFGFSRTTLAPLKAASIAVASMEVVRDSSPAADALIRDSLADALAERLDRDFIDPANAGTADVKPASITNGVTGTTASGTDVNGVLADLKAMYQTFIAANNAPTSGVFIMDGTTALALSLMLNAYDQPAFPGMTMQGGILSGLPAIVSNYVPLSKTTAPVEHQIFLVNASDIYYATEGGVDVSMSTEASLEMDDAPTGSGSLVSLWQQNLVGFRVEQTVNWAKRRDNVVARIKGATYGG